LYLRADT